MKKFTLLVLSLFVALFATARVVVVPTSADYPTYYAAAMDGDTLMLYSGSYANQALPAMKTITVMAPDTCDVVLSGQINGGESVDGGSLFFENVTIGNSGHLISYNSEGTIKTFSFKNCTITGLSNCLILMGGDASKSYVENLVYDHCVFTNNNTGYWNQMWTVVPFGHITYNECTFYANDKVESFYCPRASTDGSLEFVFTHNTVYQGARDAGRYIANIGGSYSGADSKAVFENNIIICPEGKVAGGLLNVTAGFWEVSIKNNLVIGYGIPEASDVMDYTAENNYTLEELGLTNGSVFVNPAQGDFTIYTVSPLNGKATDGGVLGASKWLLDAGVLYTLTQGLAEGVDAAAGSISGPSGQLQENSEITLTANRNYGFKFVKWVDAAGTTLSEDASYTFAMTSDKTVYAVFETIPMYKLDLNIIGGGAVTISEKGQNGEYAYFEEGTELILTAVTNTITDFVMWTNNLDIFDGSLTYTLTMTADVALTAEFTRKSFVCGWEFDTNRNASTQNREADYLSDNYADKEAAPLLKMCYTYNNTDDAHSGWWNRGESNRLAATAWKRYTPEGGTGEYKFEDGSFDETKYLTQQAFYFQTCINTKQYEDVSVCYAIKTMYYGYDTYKLEYSYNNLAWEVAGTASVTSGWQDFCDTIPNSAGKEMLYIRLIPDVTGGVHGNIHDVDGTHFADIYVLAKSDGTSIKSVKAEPVVALRDGQLQVTGLEGQNEVALYRVDGRLVRRAVETSNFVWNMSNMPSGVYVLNVAGNTTRIMVR